ncbi:MAG TPA: hypothetical protein VHG28_23100 [Longimicrobiaceae bacterium]|nr:hypothetical protein [Longimicrobiaceae bacterium]
MLQSAGTRDSGAAPVIVRIAGLPVDAVDDLATELCAELSALADLEARLQEARAGMVDRLFAAVPDAEPELRSLLLAAKRDCHNGRPLARHTRTPEWERLRSRIGPVADRVVALEQQLAEWSAAFHDSFARERERQRRRLVERSRDRAFFRGLALASTDLADAVRRLQSTDPRAYDRRDERAMLALLRYVSRAAVKISPFSTLTPIALGTLRNDLGPVGLRLRPGPWHGRSLLRLKRYLLHQHVEMLCRYPAFRDRLPVVLNDSIVEIAPERFLFLRPSRWEPDPEEGVLRYRHEALVRGDFRGPVVSRLSEVLGEGRPTYRELVDSLAEDLAGDTGAGDVQQQIDGMLDVGFLCLALPWPVHEGHLEKRMLRHLRSLPPDPGLDAFAARLEHLVALEDGYHEAADPVRSLREMQGLIDELWQTAARLGGLDPQRIRRGGTATYNLYEDVLIRAKDDAPPSEILHVSRPAVEAALRNTELLVRLTSLFDHGHEFRRTFAAFAADRWPDRREMGALELFQGARTLWKDYARFYADWWKNRSLEATWNPLDLPEVEALRARRAEVLEGLPGCLLHDGTEQRVDAEKLRELIERVPAPYTDAAAWGACLLLLPASTDGSLWMLNRVKEGTGRYGSRYTPAMDREVRRWYTDYLIARGAFTVDGERAELLDVQCVQGDTLNVHAPQTPSVLTLPGDEADVPVHRRVSLGDLRICFDGAERQPVVRGPDGQRYLPVHLGMAFGCYMPQLLRFLCAFGPNEMGGVFPGQPKRREGQLVVADRTVLGNLVLRRRTWWVPARALAEAAGDPDDAQAFVRINRLRAAWGVPDRVFFDEPLPDFFFGTVYKPQYLDFTSPLFLPLLRSALEECGDSLTLVEMLPTSEMCPPDDAGRRRVVEVMVDSLVLRSAHPHADFLELGARAGRDPAAIVGG